MVNRAIELVSNARTMSGKWDELWEVKKEIELKYAQNTAAKSSRYVPEDIDDDTR